MKIDEKVTRLDVKSADESKIVTDVTVAGTNRKKREIDVEVDVFTGRFV